MDSLILERRKILVLCSTKNLSDDHLSPWAFVIKWELHEDGKVSRRIVVWPWLKMGWLVKKNVIGLKSGLYLRFCVCFLQLSTQPLVHLCNYVQLFAHKHPHVFTDSQVFFSGLGFGCWRCLRDKGHAPTFYPEEVFIFPYLMESFDPEAFPSLPDESSVCSPARWSDMQEPVHFLVREPLNNNMSSVNAVSISQINSNTVYISKPRAFKLPSLLWWRCLSVI